VRAELAEGLAREGKSVGAMTVNDPLRRRFGPLHFAAFSGKLEMCRFLIKDLHLDVDADAERGNYSAVLFLALCLIGGGCCSSAAVELQSFLFSVPSSNCGMPSG
jgi:hypothetical protein